jgi:hypothetical protein
MKLSEWIVRIVEKVLPSQGKDGAFPPGHNGPYHDPDTPVRNTGHWLITLAKCHELTGETKFERAASAAAEYLRSETARPGGYAFHHRSKEKKDRCNGLIGQAWTFEALAAATELTGDERYARLGEEVFFQHPFREAYGLWSRLDTDGKILPMDITYNHQLWFAACAVLLQGERQEEIASVARAFLDGSPRNLTILDDGLLYHHIPWLVKEAPDVDRNFLSRCRLRLKRPVKAVLSWTGLRPLRPDERMVGDYVEEELYRSVGYQCFNMYAFAILKKILPDHPLWETGSFKKSVDYMLKEEYKTGLDENDYGYSYNPPGFEVPVSLEGLKEMGEALVGESRWWVNEQFRRCFNRETGLMDRNTEDAVTNTARLYEVTRLSTELLETITIEV